MNQRIQGFWFNLMIVILTMVFCKQSLSQPNNITLGSQYHIKSKVLAQSRELNVYLPPNYQSSKKRYPVLYLIDGGLQQNFIHIAGLASLAADYRHIDEFIVIGIKTNDRYHELTSPSQDPLDNKELPTNGGAASFRTFILDEVKPWVAQQFRVNQKSAIIGESLAGLFICETLATAPQSFTDYIAISPSLWWNKQALIKQLPELLNNQVVKVKPRVFISIANEGGAMRQGVDSFVKQYQRHQFDLKFAPLINESHGTIYHPSALSAVRWIFALPQKQLREK